MTWFLETQTGIVIKHNPTMAEYRATCREEAQRRNRMPWVIGGLINAGTEKFGEEAPAAWDLFHDYDDGTIANYASTERRVPMENRREDLSFGHHAVIAHLKPADQKKWLDRCAKEGWRRDEFRRQVRGLEPKDEVTETLNSIIRGIDRLLGITPSSWWSFLKMAKSALMDAANLKTGTKTDHQIVVPGAGRAEIPSLAPERVME